MPDTVECKVYFANWAKKQRDPESIGDLIVWVDDGDDGSMILDLKHGDRHLSIAIDEFQLARIVALAKDKGFLPSEGE